MGAIDDVISKIQAVVSNVSALNTTLGTAVGNLATIGTSLASSALSIAALNTTLGSTFPRINGTFTLSAATVTVVTQPSISASGIPWWTPTNATAALTVRTAGLFLSAVTAGASFSVSTQTGAAIGTETFKYVVLNPS